jgi:hypothetical protein
MSREDMHSSRNTTHSDLRRNSRAFAPLKPLAATAFLLAASLLPGAASAQEVRSTLLGRVVDLSSNTVVAGADVVLVDTDRVTTTDDSGSFTFEDLVPGTYVVEVRQLGYERHTDEISLEAGERLEVRFSIGIEAIPLEPITVVARSRSVETDAADAGRRFDGMNRYEIEQVLGRVSTMADLLREARTPGVSIVNMTTWVCAEHGRVTRNRRNARGTESCRPMSVYVDGVRAMNPGEVLQDVVPETVERFEILGPMQGTTLYGPDAESGVIVIETKRGGRRLGAPLILYAHDQPRWVFSFGAVGTIPSFTHNGFVELTFAGGSTSSFYEERSAWRGGLRASAAVRVFGHHRARIAAYQVFGSSTGRYSSIRFGEPATVQTRGHRSGGLDFTYQPRLKASENYDLRFEFGPTVSWQRIRLSEGHNNEWADPIGGTSPSLNWQDRTWTSFGAIVGMELTRMLDQNWSWFVGGRVRALYYGDSESWEVQNIQDISQQTGNIVFPTYHQPLALHPAFSVGLSWRSTPGLR